MTCDTLSVNETLIYLGGPLAIGATVLPWVTTGAVMERSSEPVKTTQADQTETLR